MENITIQTWTHPCTHTFGGTYFPWIIWDVNFTHYLMIASSLLLRLVHDENGVIIFEARDSFFAAHTSKASFKKAPNQVLLGCSFTPITVLFSEWVKYRKELHFHAPGPALPSMPCTCHRTTQNSHPTIWNEIVSYTTKG